MSNEREVLIAEANLLNLEFQANIPSAKLQQMIDAAKAPMPLENEPEAEEKPLKRSLSQIVKDAKAKAMKKVVVTITNKDNRENDVMTTVTLGYENQYFGVSRIIPLDIPVEIEQSLVNLAEGTMMTLHKDEIKDGKRTGNKVAVTVKKFAISYSKQGINE